MAKKNNKIPNISPKQKHLLNDKVALVENDEDESNPHFKISYKYYNSNLCEIKDLQGSSARKCLDKLKQFGQSNHKTLFENNIRPKKVHNAGNYRTLFSNLSGDVDLFEIDLGDASRLFYFIVGHLLHIVSIKNSHIKC
jgi:hypothetical protein